jgi:hypothetical protein
VCIDGITSNPVMNHNGTPKYQLMQCNQNKNVYHYINLKRKLLKRNANNNFNKACLKRHTLPNYTRIKHHNNITIQKINNTHKTRNKISVSQETTNQPAMYTTDTTNCAKGNTTFYLAHYCMPFRCCLYGGHYCTECSIPVC